MLYNYIYIITSDPLLLPPSHLLLYHPQIPSSIYHPHTPSSTTLRPGILPKAEPSSLLYEFSEVSNLQFQLVDGITSPGFLVVGSIHHLPQLFNLLWRQKGAFTTQLCLCSSNPSPASS